MTVTLDIANLSAGYGKRAIVTGITAASLTEGTVTALIGPNGAGKSTLLRALAGFLPATGTASLGGQDILALDPAIRSGLIGFMPQTLPGDVGLTVLDSVITAVKVSQPALTVRAARERAVHALERLGILAMAQANLGRLSGGQKQMASLAQTIAPGPRLLLLDEPISALDLHHQFHVMQTVRSLAAEGRIVLAILHDLKMASRWSDRFLILHEGRLHADGTPREVMTPHMLETVYRVRARVGWTDEGEMLLGVDGTIEHFR